MSLKSLFLLVTLAAILCMLIRESIQQVSIASLMLSCGIAAGLGFGVGAILCLRRRRISRRQNWCELLLWTIIPPAATCVGWLPIGSIGKVLPMTIVGSIFIIVLATVGANNEWPDEEDE